MVAYRRWGLMRMIKKISESFNESLVLLMALGLALPMSGWLLIILYQSSFSATDFALDETTVTVIERVDNRNIHCSTIDDLSYCLDDFEKFQSQMPLTVILGNSQLHAINQYTVGEKNAVALLHSMALERDRYVIGLSYPNMNFLQKLVAIEYLAREVKVDQLVIPLVFDDTRELGLGTDFRVAFDDEEFRRSFSNTPFGASILERFYNPVGGDDNVAEDMDGLQGSVQGAVETFLNEVVASRSALWAARAELRSTIFGNLYLLRNWIFDISASSVRRKIPGTYRLNMTALDQIIESATSQGIEVIVYIAPIRSDVSIPYDAEEYEIFKAEALSICKAHGCFGTSLEGLVPNQSWGLKESTSFQDEGEVDFMHFQFEGHILLANAITRLIFGEN